jgi:hypothetical protein
MLMSMHGMETQKQFCVCQQCKQVLYFLSVLPHMQVTDDTIGDTVRTVAMDAEKSANNVTQQTPETLTVIDNTLTSVADFVNGPNASTIDYTVRETFMCASHNNIMM